MSQIDEGLVLPGADEQEQMDSKLVPVSESIRYRKRAQSAEKKSQELAEQLSQKEAELSALTAELEKARSEQKLIGKLYQAGVRDMETALLLAKTRLGDDGRDMDGCIEQLRKEKSYLFDSQPIQGYAMQKAVGAKEKEFNVHTVLARAAKKAATSGDRRDLQEYLIARRNYL